MDTVLWIVQVVLAIAFAGAGFTHIRAAAADPASPRRPGMEWMSAVPPNALRTIGILEVLGAIGLVVPPLTGIAPWLAPVAAAALALLMVFAIVFHARRGNETMNIVFNAILGAVALVVAIGRGFVEPF